MEITEQDVRGLIIGLVVALYCFLIRYLISRIKQTYSKQKSIELEQDIDFIDNTKTSIYNLNRVFFSFASFTFLLVGLANAIPTLLSIFGANSKLQILIELILWSFVAFLGFKMTKMFVSLKDTKGELEKIEKKLSRVHNK
jgi:hypothetical protein